MDTLIRNRWLEYYSAAVALFTIGWKVYSTYRVARHQRAKSGSYFPLLRLVVASVTASIAILSVAGRFWLEVIENAIPKREVAVVLVCLLLIVASIIITIYFNPSRMTVVAGVALGFIGAVLLLEAFLWLSGAIDGRLAQEQKKASIQTFQSGWAASLRGPRT
jgi:hypothetical protein